MMLTNYDELGVRGEHFFMVITSYDELGGAYLLMPDNVTIDRLATDADLQTTWYINQCTTYE